MESGALDKIVLSALGDLAAFLRQGAWRGRENELVNLFAFGYLLPRACPPGGPLHPTQVAIEVAVPQVADWSAKQKADVRKDLVLWRYPSMTNWNASPETPDPILAILEWKSLNNIGVKESRAQKARDHASDVDWLCRATRARTGCSGYAIFVDLPQNATVSCRVVRSGREAYPHPYIFPSPV